MHTVQRGTAGAVVAVRDEPRSNEQTGWLSLRLVAVQKTGMRERVLKSPVLHGAAFDAEQRSTIHMSGNHKEWSGCTNWPITLGTRSANAGDVVTSPPWTRHCVDGTLRPANRSARLVLYATVPDVEATSASASTSTLELAARVVALERSLRILANGLRLVHPSTGAEVWSPATVATAATAAGAPSARRTARVSFHQSMATQPSATHAAHAAAAAPEVAAIRRRDVTVGQVDG